MAHDSIPNRSATRRTFLTGLAAAGVSTVGVTGVGGRTAGNDRNPILMVHGFLDSGETPWWDLTTYRLEEIGYDESQLSVLSLGALATTVDSPKVYAGEVASRLESISATHDSAVDIIAHSMGGLDSRWAIEKMGANEYVDSLITLGTPHQGTYVAYLAYITPGGRTMVPNSEFLQALNDGQLAADVNYTAIWSNLDALITPDEFATLPEPEASSISTAQNVFVPYKGHIQLSFDREVFETYVPHLG